MSKAGFFILINILFVGIFANVNGAQTATCAVKINVKSEDGVLVKGTTATATNYETKDFYQAVIKNEMPFFPQLTKGGYKISITKPGFKQSVGGIPVKCEMATDILEVLMSKGSGDETFDITVRPKTRILTSEEEKSLNARLREKAKISGILNFDAVYLEKPKYPSKAKLEGVYGVVMVQITVNEKGRVESAEAVEGHLLLREAAVDAAKKARFNPALKDGEPVKFSGKLVYNFANK